MLQSLIIAVFTIIVLLVMAGSFVYFYLRSLQSELYEDWQILLDNLRYKLDKIPNLLETVRNLTTGQDQLIAETIKLRAECWPMARADKTIVYKQLAVSQNLKALFASAKQFPALAKDTNFLALKTELKEVSGQLESLSERYNNNVRKYNKIVGIIFLLPFVLVLRFSRFPIFEYES